MKSFVKSLTVALSMLIMFEADCKPVLRITCRAKGVELDLFKKAIDEWKDLHHNQCNVEIVTLPHASNECFALYQQWLSAGSFDVDILLMDVAWIGIFLEYLANLEELCPTAIDLSDYFEVILKIMKNGDHIVALPLYADCGIMYYRKDLLQQYGRQVPTTWEELYDIAKYIQEKEREDVSKKDKFFGYVFQAKAFEILTCNFVEVLDSFGGSVVTGNKVTVNSEQGNNATLFMIKCLKNITSRSVLNYSEEDARGMFQSGQAVFMRNWPYAWSLMNEPSTPVAGKIGVMPIPGSANGKDSGVLGGWFLTVSKYSKNKKIAADLVQYLTSYAQHKIRARYSYSPAFKSLYEDPEVLKYHPIFGLISKVLKCAVARPSVEFGKSYPRASAELFSTVNSILSEVSDLEQFDEKQVKRTVQRMLGRASKHLQRLLDKRHQLPNNEKKKTSSSGFFSWFKNLFSK